MSVYTTLGGRIVCTQCSAKSKSSQERCRNPAIKGKTKCKHHGGYSTGSKSAEGKAKQIAANTKYGTETRAIRKERSTKFAELDQLENLAHRAGVMVGPKRKGRKPNVE